MARTSTHRQPRLTGNGVLASLNYIHAKSGEGLEAYTSRRYLHSPAENRFHHALRTAVGQRYTIACKVRLADVVTCPQRLWNSGMGRRIAQKHLDFLLLDPNSSEFVLAIELNDATHYASDRSDRDTFVASVLGHCDIPLLQVQARSRYHPRELRATIRAALAFRRPTLFQRILLAIRSCRIRSC